MSRLVATCAAGKMKQPPVLFNPLLMLVILPLDHHCPAPTVPFLNHKPVGRHHTSLAAVYINPTLTCSPPISSGAMASCYSTRSRSRTTSRPRTRGAGSSSRPSTSTSLTDYGDSIPLHAAEAFHTWDTREVYWRPPDRHVLIIVNFQDLAGLTSRAQQLPANADFLDAACRVYLDAIEENSLFTSCRHFNHRESLETPILAIFAIAFETPGTFAFPAMPW